MKINVAFFFGCRSVEHEVSIISAVQAMKNIDKEKYNVIPVYVSKTGEMYTGEALFEIKNYRNIEQLVKGLDAVTFKRNGEKVVMSYEKASVFSSKKPVTVDVAFPVVHGTNCEDGTIQGFFEFLGLAYVGCDILSSAVGMDKVVFKDVLKRNGLPVLDCVCFYARDFALEPQKIMDEIETKIGFPVIVKPVNLGSSVGIKKVNCKEELYAALEYAAAFADKILAERAVTDLREINCSVLGDANDCKASVCEEPFMNDEILSYEDKYLGGSKSSKGGSKGMASLARKVPADLNESKSEEIRTLATDIFKILGCNGVVRIDFIIDTKTDKVYANEINTIPGSLAFYLWEATGVKYSELLDTMISLAFARKRNRENLSFSIDTNILSNADLGGAKSSKGGKL